MDWIRRGRIRWILLIAVLGTSLTAQAASAAGILAASHPRPVHTATPTPIATPHASHTPDPTATPCNDILKGKGHGYTVCAPAGSGAISGPNKQGDCGWNPFCAVVQWGIGQIFAPINNFLNAIWTFLIGGDSLNIWTRTDPSLTYANPAVAVYVAYTKGIAYAVLGLFFIIQALKITVGRYRNQEVSEAVATLGPLVMSGILVTSIVPVIGYAVDTLNGIMDIMPFGPWATIQKEFMDGLGVDGVLSIVQVLSAVLVTILMMLVVSLQMLVRIGTLDLLIVLAPLAVMCLALPETRPWWQQWLRFFVATLLSQFAQMIALNLALGFIVTEHSVVRGLLSQVIGIAMLIMVVRVPKMLHAGGSTTTPASAARSAGRALRLGRALVETGAAVSTGGVSGAARASLATGRVMGGADAAAGAGTASMSEAAVGQAFNVAVAHPGMTVSVSHGRDGMGRERVGVRAYPPRARDDAGTAAGRTLATGQTDGRPVSDAVRRPEPGPVVRDPGVPTMDEPILSPRMVTERERGIGESQGTDLHGVDAGVAGRAVETSDQAGEQRAATHRYLGELATRLTLDHAAAGRPLRTTVTAGQNATIMTARSLVTPSTMASAPAPGVPDPERRARLGAWIGRLAPSVAGEVPHPSLARVAERLAATGVEPPPILRERPRDYSVYADRGTLSANGLFAPPEYAARLTATTDFLADGDEQLARALTMDPALEHIVPELVHTGFTPPGFRETHRERPLEGFRSGAEVETILRGQEKAVRMPGHMGGDAVRPRSDAQPRP